MKHLKLFESFESNILSKTLKYLSKSSRNNFLNEVKRICGELDFPLSKLTDDYFEYLPFNSALKKVDGHNKIYKFWLNKEGDFLYETLTDTDRIEVKKELETIGDYVGVGEIYKNFNDLSTLSDRSKIIMIANNGIRDMEILGTLFIENGNYYCIHNNSSFDGSQPFGREWKQYGRFSWSLASRTAFVSIQEAEPAKKSYDILKDYLRSNKTELSSKNIDEIADYFRKKIEEFEKDDNPREKAAKETIEKFSLKSINYYFYNKHTRDDKTSNKKSLAGAEFAIIFNTGKLKDYKKVSTIKSERDEMKSGAQSLKDPEDIRKSNIEKRLMVIAKKEFNIDTFNSLFDKVLFDKWILFFNLPNTLKDIEQIIKLWEDGAIDDDQTYMSQLKDWYHSIPPSTKRDDISKYFKNQIEAFTGSSYSSNDDYRNLAAKETLIKYGVLSHDNNQLLLTNSIFKILKKSFNLRTDLLKRESTKKPNCKLLSNKLAELGQLVINKIKPSKLNDIDDIIIAEEKLKTISRVLLSDRYDFKKSHDSIIYLAKGLSTEDGDRWVVEGYIDTLNKMIKLISKI